MSSLYYICNPRILQFLAMNYSERGIIFWNLYEKINQTFYTFTLTKML
nr:MAG TPA: hypothetical protein [Caudoviricetes sp.]